MKLNRPYSLKEIAQLINCQFIGDENHLVTGLNEIHGVENGDLVFVDHHKYYSKALNSAATTILIDKIVDCPEGKALIISDKPFDSYNFLAKLFAPISSPHNQEQHYIHPSAVIYPNVFIGKNVRIGKNSRIYPGVALLDNTTIGENVFVGPNSVLGYYAFYYKKKENIYDRMHTIGGVEIGDNVEIGASCTIDAGVSSITKIGKGTKIDNHVHIGHDVVVGENCLMAAGVGIAGCTTIEDEVTLWGQVGCTSNVTIGKGAVILAQSGISKDLEGGKTYFGSPCGEVKEKFKEMAALRMLPNVIKKL